MRKRSCFELAEFCQRNGSFSDSDGGDVSSRRRKNAFALLLHTLHEDAKGA